MTESLINKKYGLWKVLSEPFQTGRRVTKVKAICECGVTKTPILYELKSGGSKSCGCRGRKMHRVKSGDQFNYWTIISEAKKRGEERLVHCECKCGYKSIVRLKEIVRGRSKSCGCRRNEWRHAQAS